MPNINPVAIQKLYDEQKNFMADLIKLQKVLPRLVKDSSLKEHLQAIKKHLVNAQKLLNDLEKLKNGKLSDEQREALLEQVIKLFKNEDFQNEIVELVGYAKELGKKNQDPKVQELLLCADSIIEVYKGVGKKFLDPDFARGNLPEKLYESKFVSDYVDATKELVKKSSYIKTIDTTYVKTHAICEMFTRQIAFLLDLVILKECLARTDGDYSADIRAIQEYLGHTVGIMQKILGFPKDFDLSKFFSEATAAIKTEDFIIKTNEETGMNVHMLKDKLGVTNKILLEINGQGTTKAGSLNEKLIGALKSDKRSEFMLGVVEWLNDEKFQSKFSNVLKSCEGLNDPAAGLKWLGGLIITPVQYAGRYMMLVNEALRYDRKSVQEIEKAENKDNMEYDINNFVQLDRWTMLRYCKVGNHIGYSANSVKPQHKLPGYASYQELAKKVGRLKSYSSSGSESTNSSKSDGSGSVAPETRKRNKWWRKKQ